MKLFTTLLLVAVASNLFAGNNPRVELSFINGLRGLAILLVLADHWFLWGIKSPSWVFSKSPDWLIASGQRGVQLFFIVSAFTLFLSSSHRTSTEAHPIRNFYLFAPSNLPGELRLLIELTVVASICLAGGILLHRFIEKPFVAAGAKLIDRLEKEPLSSSHLLTGIWRQRSKGF